MKPYRLRQLVDELGAIKAQLADLAKREEAIKAQLIEHAHDTAQLENYPAIIEGQLYRAAVSCGTRTNVDWQAIANRLGASHQLVRANTTSTPVTTVRVSARSQEAA